MTPALKICGVNDGAFAVEAARCGADFLGFIFAEASPRRVTPGKASAIRAQVLAAGAARSPRFVGVFTDTPADEIATVAALVPLDDVETVAVGNRSNLPENVCHNATKVINFCTKTVIIDTFLSSNP